MVRHMKPTQLKLVYPEKKPRYVSRRRGKALMRAMVEKLEARFGKG